MYKLIVITFIISMVFTIFYLIYWFIEVNEKESFITAALKRFVKVEKRKLTVATIMKIVGGGFMMGFGALVLIAAFGVEPLNAPFAIRYAFKNDLALYCGMLMYLFNAACYMISRSIMILYGVYYFYRFHREKVEGFFQNNAT